MDNIKQVVSRRGVVLCTTSIPYPKRVIESMRKAGLEVKEVKDKK